MSPEGIGLRQHELAEQLAEVTIWTAEDWESLIERAQTGGRP